MTHHLDTNDGATPARVRACLPEVKRLECTASATLKTSDTTLVLEVEIKTGHGLMNAATAVGIAISEAMVENFEGPYGLIVAEVMANEATIWSVGRTIGYVWEV